MTTNPEAAPDRPQCPVCGCTEARVYNPKTRLIAKHPQWRRHNGFVVNFPHVMCEGAGREPGEPPRPTGAIYHRVGNRIFPITWRGHPLGEPVFATRPLTTPITVADGQMGLFELDWYEHV